MRTRRKRSVWRKRPQPRRRILRLTNAASFGVGYFVGVNGSGQKASTPDDASLDITGDLQLIVGVAFNQVLAKTTRDNLITKADGTPQYSFVLDKLELSDDLLFGWKESGGTFRSVTADGIVPTTLGQFRWYKVEFTASTATAAFYSSNDSPQTAVDTISWSLHSSPTLSLSTNIFSGTAPLWIGNRSDNPAERLDGRVYYAEVRNGIGGTVVANPDFRYRTDYTAPTSLTDQAGKVWTVTAPGYWALPLQGAEPAGGSATVTPATIAVTVAVPTPTISAAAVVTPATIAVTVSLPTPVAQGQARVTPAVIPIAVTLPTPTILAAATVTPAAIGVTTSLPTPTVLAGAQVTPAVIPVTVTLPTPTVRIDVVVSPATIAVTVALPTPTVLAAATIVPATIAVTVTLPTPAVLAGAQVAPAAIPLTVTLPTPAVLAGARVTPAVIPITVTLPTPTIDVSGGTTTVTPATIAVTVTLPTPAVLAGANVTPTTIAVTVSLPTPAVLAAARVFPAVIPLTTTLPTPQPSIPAVTSPTTLVVVATLPTPTILAAALVTPTTLAILVGVPTPTVTAGATVTPAVIPILITFPGPTIALGIIPFWIRSPVGWTQNPAAFVSAPVGYDPIEGGEDSPWD